MQRHRGDTYRWDSLWEAPTEMDINEVTRDGGGSGRHPTGMDVSEVPIDGDDSRRYQSRGLDLGIIV